MPCRLTDARCVVFDRQAMAGCRGSYRVIQSLDECVAAKAAVEPSFGGVQTGGFGQEWANGCFYNSGTVYFHTDGDVRAHTDAQSYRVNGGWSASHKALCVRSTIPFKDSSPP